MAIEKVNMIQSSKNYTGTTLETFLRSMDSRAALGRYVMDQAAKKTFFGNLPGVMSKKVSAEDRVWDIVRIDEKFNMVWGGPGLPGPFKQTRQLAGNEDVVNAGYRRNKMTAGMHRYAVAIENFLQTDLLPQQMMAFIKWSLSAWATNIQDNDTACTLFRDYPYYYAELDWLTVTEVDERVLSIFGRGTYNDISASPLMIMPNGVTDIENLWATDTLSDIFVRYLQMYADQELWMKSITMEDWRPFFGLIIGDPDIQNFYDNSSAQFTSTLNEAFKWSQWNHPLFKKFIGEFAQIRFVKYWRLAANDGRDEFADWAGVYKHLMGSVFEPIEKVLAVARGDETLVDLITRDRGAYDLTTPGLRSGLDGDGNNYNLYVSMGATDFPYYEGSKGAGTGSTVVGAESYNRYELTAAECANAYCPLSAGDYVGRLQIGEGDDAWEKWKVLYTGPVYVGTMQMAPNKTTYGQVQKIYRKKIVGLYTRDGANWNLVSNANIATEFNNLKAFLGVDASNKIQYGGTYSGVTYQRRRKGHVFNTIRSILFGEMLMYDLDLLKGSTLKMEERDYGALTGRGMTMGRGRKLMTAADGSIRNYAIVVFKRPSMII